MLSYYVIMQRAGISAFPLQRWNYQILRKYIFFQICYLGKFSWRTYIVKYTESQVVRLEPTIIFQFLVVQYIGYNVLSVKMSNFTELSIESYVNNICAKNTLNFYYLQIFMSLFKEKVLVVIASRFNLITSTNCDHWRDLYTNLLCGYTENLVQLVVHLAIFRRVSDPKQKYLGICSRRH